MIFTSLDESVSLNGYIRSLDDLFQKLFCQFFEKNNIMSTFYDNGLPENVTTKSLIEQMWRRDIFRYKGKSQSGIGILYNTILGSDDGFLKVLSYMTENIRHSDSVMVLEGSFLKELAEKLKIIKLSDKETEFERFTSSISNNESVIVTLDGYHLIDLKLPLPKDFLKNDKLKEALMESIDAGLDWSEFAECASEIMEDSDNSYRFKNIIANHPLISEKYFHDIDLYYNNNFNVITASNEIIEFLKNKSY